MIVIFREAFDDGNGDEDGQNKKDDVEGHIIVIFCWFLVEFHLEVDYLVSDLALLLCLLSVYLLQKFVDIVLGFLL